MTYGGQIFAWTLRPSPGASMGHHQLAAAAILSPMSERDRRLVLAILCFAGVLLVLQGDVPLVPNPCERHSGGFDGRDFDPSDFDTDGIDCHFPGTEHPILEIRPTMGRPTARLVP